MTTNGRPETYDDMLPIQQANYELRDIADSLRAILALLQPEPEVLQIVTASPLSVEEEAAVRAKLEAKRLQLEPEVIEVAEPETEPDQS